MRLLTEGDVLVCKVAHRKNLIHKLLQSKLTMYRWERHHLVLEDACVSSRTPTGFMSVPIRYSVVEEVSLVPPSPQSSPSAQKQLICIALHDG
jgi:hypothetical protein